MNDDQHPEFPSRPPKPRAAGDARTRWSLPLGEHPRLELTTDFARLSVVPVLAGETPWLDVFPAHPHHHGHGHGAPPPPVEVDGDGGTTRVRIAGPWAGASWWSGPWWEQAFWEKTFWKMAARVVVVAHVPAGIEGAIRSSAGKVQVSGLSGCDLALDTDAGAVLVEDVSGRLKLSTQAGRIDARRVSGSLDITSNAGAVTAEVLALAPGAHHVRTSVGAVRLELARGMPVRIDARTTMGATRVDFPSVADAPAVLDVEADLGAIRVIESSRAWDGTAAPGGPYRAPARASAPSLARDEEVQRVLERVADGSITPEVARELLRALGVA